MEGNELTTAILAMAYREGIYPMTLPDESVGWFQPRSRTLLPTQGIHVSRSLQRVIRGGRFAVTFDKAFESVMRHCLRPDDNWISEEFIRVYTSAYLEGWGHSCECWLGGRLVGGVYGLSIGRYFAAESMFHRVTDASKIALWAMVEQLRDRGFQLIDAQQMNPHLASLGAFEVPHDPFIERLHEAVRAPNAWPKRHDSNE